MITPQLAPWCKNMGGSKREAPALMKRNGVYFILSSTTSGWDPNQVCFGTATSLSGTWSSLQNVGNSTTFDSQPTFLLFLLRVHKRALTCI